MFDESNSLSSKNLPDTIWLTSFGGTGEKPGATTNDGCKTGTVGEEENAVGRSPVATLEGEGATESGPLLGIAWDCKLDENVAGTPPAMLEVAATLVGVCSAASACLPAATTETRKAGDGTSASR